MRGETNDVRRGFFKKTWARSKRTQASFKIAPDLPKSPPERNGREQLAVGANTQNMWDQQIALKIAWVMQLIIP
jgi:hypothetical protein